MTISSLRQRRWIKRTEIPPEYSRWGAFNELIERNNDALHTIAEKTSQTHSRSEARTGNTESRRLLRERHGRKGDRSMRAPSRWPTSSRKSTRSKIAQDVLKEIAHLHSIGINAFFNFGAGPGRQGQHARHRTGSARRARHARSRLLHEAGRRLRKKSASKYVAHVTKMLTLVRRTGRQGGGRRKEDHGAGDKAGRSVPHSRAVARPDKNYNKMGVRQLQDLTPDWNWSDYFNWDQSARAGRHQRASAGVFQNGKRPFQNDVTRRLEGVSALAPDQRNRALSFQRFCERKFRF